MGRGEQGVLICEPYKSEIGQNWRFKTEAIAIESSEKSFAQFLEYWPVMNLWVPTWHVNICRWVIPVPGVTPIIKAAGNMMPTIITRYWNGEPAKKKKQGSIRLLCKVRTPCGMKPMLLKKGLVFIYRLSYQTISCISSSACFLF